jgi:hypothetical protein
LSKLSVTFCIIKSQNKNLWNVYRSFVIEKGFGRFSSSPSFLPLHNPNQFVSTVTRCGEGKFKKCLISYAYFIIRLGGQSEEKARRDKIKENRNERRINIAVGHGCDNK